MNDERIVKAKELINETIKEYQTKFIQSVSPSSKSISKDLTYAKNLRGGSLFFLTLVQA